MSMFLKFENTSPPRFRDVDGDLVITPRPDGSGIDVEGEVGGGSGSGGGITMGQVNAAIGSHNTDNSAHADIRQSVTTAVAGIDAAIGEVTGALALKANAADVAAGLAGKADAAALTAEANTRAQADTTLTNALNAHTGNANIHLAPADLISAEWGNILRLDRFGKLYVPRPDQPDVFVDERDGQVYRTVQIGSQIWMAENLNYETPDSSVYNNNPANGKKYGRFYNWNDALNVAPAGWHLPSYEEWTVLANYIGGYSIAGKKLKSKSGWYDNGNGTDEYGFSALSSGVDYQGFTLIDKMTRWWTTNGNGINSAYSAEMNHDNNALGKTGSPTIAQIRYSVRLIKDAGV